MKKILLLTMFSFGVGSVMAQTFKDDFESYVADSTVGTQSSHWTTWSNNDGSEEDVNVTTTKAHSGTKSLYFTSSSANGGPIDCVLPFGGVHHTGKFTFTSWLFVDSAKTAYFNLQGDSVMGKIFTIETHLNANGTIVMESGGSEMLAASYPQNAWFELKLDINLNTSSWNVYINNTSVGKFNNKIYQIAAIDLYPANNRASYWVDDVSYQYEAYALPALNGALLGIQLGKGIAGQKKTPAVVVRNLGTQAITSYNITYRVNGSSVTHPVTGVNIASLETATAVAAAPITLLAGNNIIEAEISNVNGASGNDGDLTDDSVSLEFKAPQPAPGKMVVGEEGTGTWCGYCPRGTVAMKNMEEYKGYFAGIAVHNNDPMEHVHYDSAMGTIIAGYPSALVDRGDDIDPLGIEDAFLKNIVVAPKALLINGALYDNATRQLKVSVTTTFQEALSGDYRIACVITEDSVTGTGNGYNQRNYYANNQLGPMGGFELLPDPVPAAQMVYDHVARVISPSFYGHQNSFPSSVAQGSKYTLNFIYNLPATWKERHLHIIGMLIDPAGKIENASSASISDGVKNGYITGTVVTGITQAPAPDKKISFYPNPVSGNAFLEVQLEKDAAVSLEVYGISGALLGARNYGKLSGSYRLPVHTADLEPGVYLLKIYVDGKPSISRFVKQ